MHEIFSLSETAQSLKPGKYEHFKGEMYEVLGVGRMSEEQEGGEYIVYKSLEKGYIWIRPLSMFLEEIDRNGYKGSRFKFLGND